MKKIFALLLLLPIFAFGADYLDDKPLLSDAISARVVEIESITLSRFAGLLATNTVSTDVLFIGDSITSADQSVASYTLQNYLHRTFGISGTVGSSVFGGLWNSPTFTAGATIGNVKGGPDFFDVYIITNTGTVVWSNYATAANYGEMADAKDKGVSVTSAGFCWVANPNGGDFKFQVSQEGGAFTDKLTVSGFAATRQLRWTNLVQTTHWTSGNRTRFQVVNVSGTNEIGLYNRLDSGAAYPGIVAGIIPLSGLTMTNIIAPSLENWDTFFTNAFPRLGLVVVAVRDPVDRAHSQAVTNLISRFRRGPLNPDIVFVGPYKWTETSTVERAEIDQLRTNAISNDAYFVDLSRRFPSPLASFLNGWITDAYTNGHPTSKGRHVFGQAVAESLKLEQLDKIVWANMTPKLFSSHMNYRPPLSLYHSSGGNAYFEAARAGGYGMGLWFNNTASGTYAGDSTVNLWSFAGNGTDTRINAPNASGTILFSQLATVRAGINSSGEFFANGAGITNRVYATNYVAADFAPKSGKIFLVASNNALYAVSVTKTNLISAP